MEPAERGLLIGVDEAGYGPNLGPLAVAATAWRLPAGADPAATDLYEALAGAVSAEPADHRIAVADSKRLYKPGGGVALLERSALAPHSHRPRRWSELVDRLGADPDGQRHAAPWRAEFDPVLPIEADSADIDAARTRLAAACVDAGVDVAGAAARLVFPAEFNDLCDRWESKGAALSHATLALVRRVIGAADPAGSVACVCDKHGGRNRYAAVLQHHFPDERVETLHESRAESRYRLGPIRIAFRARGEAFLPTAWASLVAKHLREVAMLGFNAFWTAEVPGVRPTAGYPVDAKRFKAAILDRQRELRIDDRVLWRNR